MARMMTTMTMAMIHDHDHDNDDDHDHDDDDDEDRDDNEASSNEWGKIPRLYLLETRQRCRLSVWIYDWKYLEICQEIFDFFLKNI